MNKVWLGLCAVCLSIAVSACAGTPAPRVSPTISPPSSTATLPSSPSPVPTEARTPTPETDPTSTQETDLASSTAESTNPLAGSSEANSSFDDPCARVVLLPTTGGAGQFVNRYAFGSTEPAEPVLFRLESPNIACSAVYSPNGDRILTYGSQGVQVWDAGSGNLVYSLGDEFDPEFSQDGSHLLTSGDQGMQVWDAGTGDLVSSLGNGFFPVFSPDGATIAAIAEDGTVRIWDANTGDETSTIQVEEAENFAYNGSLVATTFRNGITLWDASTGAEIQHFPDLVNDSEMEDERANLVAHFEWIKTIQFSPGNQIVLTGGEDATIRLWDISTGSQLHVFEAAGEGEEGWMYSFDEAEFSPDGSQVLAIFDQFENGSYLYIWDASSGEQLLRIEATSGLKPAYRFKTAAFSPNPDDQQILTVGTDKTVRIWDTNTGELLKLLSHTDVVNGAAYHPSGEQIVTAIGRYLKNPAAIWVWQVEHPSLIAAAEAQKLADTAPQDAANGNIEAALSKLNEALTIYPNPGFSADICKYGTLWQRAETALTSCDEIVALIETQGGDTLGKALVYTYRGIARSLTENQSGALEDFGAAMAIYQGLNPELYSPWDFMTEFGLLNRVESWSAQLQAGQDPFDENTIEELREEVFLWP